MAILSPALCFCRSVRSVTRLAAGVDGPPYTASTGTVDARRVEEGGAGARGGGDWRRPCGRQAPPIPQRITNAAPSRLPIGARRHSAPAAAAAARRAAIPNGGAARAAGAAAGAGGRPRSWREGNWDGRRGVERQRLRRPRPARRGDAPPSPVKPWEPLSGGLQARPTRASGLTRGGGAGRVVGASPDHLVVGAGGPAAAAARRGQPPRAAARPGKREKWVLVARRTKSKGRRGARGRRTWGRGGVSLLSCVARAAVGCLSVELQRV